MENTTTKKSTSDLYKNILISTLIILTVISELVLKNKLSTLPLTVSSIFIFIIIGIINTKSSFIIISIMNCFFLVLNGFDSLSMLIVIQIYFIWYLYKNNKKNILLASIFFVGIITFPFMIITTYISKSIGISNLFTMIIIVLNLISNALIADIALQLIGFRKIIDIPNEHKKKLTLSNLLTYTLISSILIPISVFMIVATYNSADLITEKAINDLTISSEYINEKVNSWTKEEKSNLKLNNPIQTEKLIDMLNMYIATWDKVLNYYLIDFDNKIITSPNNSDYTSLGIDWITTGAINEIEPNFYKWTAPSENSFIIKNYMKETAYIYETSINNSKILITVSGSQYTNTIISAYLNSLYILLALTFFLGIFIFILKNILLNSIARVINLSSDLPQKLKNKETIIFGNSNIEEINLLICNFQSMVDNVTKMILQLEITNNRLEESKELLFKKANFDYLTELPNRQYFIEHAQNTINNFTNDDIYKEKSGVAILFLDLDKFKSVNDTLGHSAGDELLQIIAKRMNEILSIYDDRYVFAARLGGDEFVIEFVFNNKNEIEYLANKIIATIKEKVKLGNTTVNVGVSIGVGIYPDDADNLESIFIKSDTSMYKAKALGGNEFSV